ncbi:MAG: hypothetical protein PF495_17665, partial [Spirochaetales bacterium]|nr:hypothetical protein [Spirochaetales bacterium]
MIKDGTIRYRTQPPSPFTNHDFFFIELFMQSHLAAIHITAFFLALFFPGFTQISLAAPPLIVVEGIESYQAGLHLELLEDTSTTLTFAEIISNPYPFETSTSASPGFGLTKVAMWGKITLENSLDHALHYYLVIDYPPLDYIDFYYPVQSTSGQIIYKQYNTGDFRPYDTRPIKTRSYAFPVDIPSKGQTTYYFRIQTSGSLNIPISLQSPQFFTEEYGFTQTIFGIYYGILLVMIVYMTFLFLTLKDKTYLYYVLFVVCFLGFQFSLNGTGFQYFWPTQTWWNNRSIPACIFGGYLFANLFAQHILNTKKHTPTLHKWINAIIPCTALGIIISLTMPYAISIKVAVLAFLTLPFIIVAGVRIMLRGYRPAFYYTLAWSISLLGISIFSLKTLGILPNIFITTWSTQIGTSW